MRKAQGEAPRSVRKYLSSTGNSLLNQEVSRCQNIRKHRKGMSDTTSVQFSHSVLFHSLRLHGLQHARPPCPSPTPGVYSNSCPLVSDDIQPSHPLLSPSLPSFNLSQHQGLFFFSFFPSFYFFMGYIHLWKLSYKILKEKCLHTDERGKNADSGVK